MIKLGTSDGNQASQPTDLPSAKSGAIRTLILPKELETEFILQCEEGETLDPIKVVEMYLAQRKYELMEAMFARKKERCEEEHCPTIEDLHNQKKKRKGHEVVKLRAKYLMQNMAKVKSVYCHSIPDEDAFGKIKRHRTNL